MTGTTSIGQPSQGLLAASLLMLISSAVPGLAQSEDRWTISIGGGLLAVSEHSAEGLEFDHRLFGSEQGEFDVDYAGGDAAHHGFSVGVRLRKRLALELTQTESSLTDNVDIAARLPHPFFHDTYRTVDGNSGGLSRDETALHLSLKWLVRDGEKVQLGLFAGPSRIDLEYDRVSAVRFNQTYPFDVASYAGVEHQRASGDAIGFHVGADVVRWLGKTIGLGLLIRFSEAEIDLDAADGSTVSVNAGGPAAAADLRFRF